MIWTPRQPPFALFPEAAHFWSLEDYGAVLGVMDALRPKRVIEFGPGSSTLALAEGGAAEIDTYEDSAEWEDVYRERLTPAVMALSTMKRFRMRRYVWTDPLQLPRGEWPRDIYDLALIDGPFGTQRRPAVVEWCLQTSVAVLVPTEENAYGRSAMVPALEQLAAKYERTLTITHTGPLSGAFALFTS
jgi:hypothetical protein